MRVPSVVVGPLVGVGGRGALRRPAAEATAAGGQSGLLPLRLRRLAMLWVAVSLPVVVAAGTLVSSPGDYLAVFALVASGFYTTPAMANTWLAARRAPRPDNVCWWLWLVALVLMYGTGCSMLLGRVVRWSTPTWLNTTVVAIISLLIMTSVVLTVRTRSGRRALSVDVIESAMSVLVVAAPAVVLWGDDVVGAEARWYAVPAAVAVVAMIFGVYWAVLLWMRLRGDERASAVGGIGVALAVVGLVNAVGQTAQGVSGFGLPSAPLLGLHGACMSLLLLVPLYVPGEITPGLDRLPPKDQVRGARLPAVLVLVALPVLLVVTYLQRDSVPWATPWSLGVMAVLLVLGALRQLATVRETRRLYGHLEQEAAMRRDLLAQVMRRSDHDRHRVAAQLHEQAVSAYAAFVSFLQASSLGSEGAAAGSVAGASTMVRDELRDQAESLRELMLAVQPLEADRHGAQSLSAPIHAYIDGLYGDRLPPLQVVNVAEDLILDWTTETVVLRIVQEAVRNVWRHSGASLVEVSVQADDGVVEVTVADDGRGFDPGDVLFESGISAMRSFAALGQGTLDIDSAPGRGTRVTARLGASPAPATATRGEGDPRSRLRLLVSDDRSVDEA